MTGRTLPPVGWHAVVEPTEARSLRWASLLGVGLYVVALDQLTKDLVRTTLAPGHALQLTGATSIEQFRNPGISGGGLASGALPGALVTLLGIAAALVLLARLGAAGRTVLVGFGLVLGGGASNLLDRLQLGYVVDFLVQGDQAFNLADVAILAGSVVIIVGLLETALPRRRPA